MEGKFTFTNKNDIEWANELFDTREEAVAEGIKVLGDGVLVGQLQASDTGYSVVNVYEFNEMAIEN